MARVWITKYALTSGIQEIECEIDETAGLAMDRSSGYTQYYHGEGTEWHRSRDAAAVRAENMRQKKIISLQKSLKKFEKLRFE